MFNHAAPQNLTTISAPGSYAGRGSQHNACPTVDRIVLAGYPRSELFCPKSSACEVNAPAVLGIP